LNNFIYIVYGLIQGITEFFPISSTAHLKIISLLVGIDDPGASLSAIVQLGSVLAILFYFREDIFYLFKKNTNKLTSFLTFNKLIKSILIATTPLIFLGGTIKLLVPNFSESYLRSNTFIGIVSIFTGILMFISNKKRTNRSELSNICYVNAFIIGIGQAFAIFPGVSRSGITITFALLLGWTREDSVKFSFLLGVPAIFLSSILELFNSIDGGLIFSSSQLFLGLLSAFLTSIISINFIFRFIQLRGLSVFVYYKIIFGTAILLMNL